MTEHLPECEMSNRVLLHDAVCSCVRLRACRERTLTEVRQAVATAPVATGGYATKQADLAVIDALRGES